MNESYIYNLRNEQPCALYGIIRNYIRAAIEKMWHLADVIGGAVRLASQIAHARLADARACDESSIGF